MNKRVIILSILLGMPIFAFAADNTGLVKCGMTDANGQLASEQCGYKELIDLIQSTLNFIIYSLATPIAALMFGVAGFQMITSGGDVGKVKSAKKIFTNVLIGYGIMLSAFLIIKLLFSLLFPEDYSLLG